MTMKFRQAKANIIGILGSNSKGCFRTVGHQSQTKDAAQHVGNDNSVTVFVNNGDFPETSDSRTSNTQHEVKFRVELTVAADVEGDLSILSDANAMAAERAQALANFKEAGEVADDRFDELVENVYQILMDASNYDLGFPRGTIANRRVGGWQKDQTVPQGELVVLTGAIFLTARMEETVLGVSSVAGTDIDTTIDLKDDDVEQTGITA